ncbi:MAG: hypothetical protein WCS77_08140 [Elusimicrobiaceae bacterium]|jgi:hypothetical protein
MSNIYVFKFEEGVEAAKAELHIVPAVIAAESLYGKGAVRLGFQYSVCPPKNSVVIKSLNEASEAAVRIFTDYAIKNFGEFSFSVERKEPAREKA